MALPSRAKAAQYRKALPIGAFLFLFQMSILVWVVFSRALSADTFHALLDVLTLTGTTFLFSKTWTSKKEFARGERTWLLIGVWSLAIGGLIVGSEAVAHLLNASTSRVPMAWPVLIAALVGAGGNLWMHRILDSVEDVAHDHLHKNNLDHVFWDMVLSFAVFVSGCSMWFFQTMAFDSWIAIGIGFFVLPYFAWKRLSESGTHKHAHTHH